MDWNDVSKEARDTMNELGGFSPTANPGYREVKGYMVDQDGECGKTYWDSNYLRLMAQHLVEVADWLDKRATSPPNAALTERGEGK